MTLSYSNTITKDDAMVKVKQIARERTEAGAILRATVECKGTSLDGVELWFCYPGEYYEYLSETGNAFVAALLFPAMRMGSNLRVEGIVSEKLLVGLQEFMAITHQWWPELTPIDIETDSVKIVSHQSQSTGLFFSGGVDSFYTLLKNEGLEDSAAHKIQHLIFIRGFDIDLEDEELWTKALQTVQATAKEMNKQLITVSTNYRRVLSGIVTWPMQFGSALMSVAFGVEGVFKRVHIAAARTYRDLDIHNGSHPLLDRLWATESLEVVHDGCEATRVEKVIKEISRSEVALDHLRVCWENRNGKYNCGECEKCIRTMVNLKIAGVLAKCRTFDRDLKYCDVANVRLSDARERSLMEENYKAAFAMKCDPKLIRALNECLNSSFATQCKRALWSGLKRVGGPVDEAILGGRLRKWYRTIRSAHESS